MKIVICVQKGAVPPDVYIKSKSERFKPRSQTWLKRTEEDCY